MRKYLIGGLVGFALAFTVSAHAEVLNMIGKVVDGAFAVKVNGTTLKNQAIVIEGTSYLPVREFGESLGMDVKFDASMGVELTQKPTPAPTPSATPSVTTTFTPIPTPAFTKEQQIESLKGAISKLEINITALKMGIGTEKDDSTMAIEYKKRLAELEKERDDKQKQLDGLSSSQSQTATTTPTASPSPTPTP